MEVSEENSHPRDSTVLEADHGAPTMEDVMRLRRKENEGRAEEAKEAKEGGDGEANERGGSSSGSPGEDPAGAGVSSPPPPPPPQSSVSAEEGTRERGDDARTRRSRDGAWTRERNLSYFSSATSSTRRWARGPG